MVVGSGQMIVITWDYRSFMFDIVTFGGRRKFINLCFKSLSANTMLLAFVMLRNEASAIIIDER